MPTPSRVDGLRVWSWPGGEPGALLLHGIGNYGRYWDLFADEIAGRLRLVAPDARGHGESPAPGSGYAAADFVADAHAVMDASGLARPLVVGHSMGGYHAAALTLAHPDRVRALALVDVGPRSESAGASRARRLSLARPDGFPDDAAALAYLRETSPGYADAVYENRLRWLFDRDRGLVWRSSKHALARILEDVARTSDAVWSRLAEIACPVLLVRGARSASLSSETLRSMRRRLRDVRVVELDAGHNVALDQPTALAGAVLDLAAAV